jgi:hypothetical protein
VFPAGAEVTAIAVGDDDVDVDFAGEAIPTGDHGDAEASQDERDVSSGFFSAVFSHGCT